MAPPVGWELALAYFDTRGEAETGLARSASEHPASARPIFGKAMLLALRGHDEEALAEGRRAYEKREVSGGNAIAFFEAETAKRMGRFAEAADWYRRAATPPNALTGPAAFEAAVLLRDRVGRPDQASSLLKVACLAGIARACEGTQRPPRP